MMRSDYNFMDKKIVSLNNKQNWNNFVFDEQINNFINELAWENW